MYEPLAIVSPALYPDKYCPCKTNGNSQGARKRMHLEKARLEDGECNGGALLPGVHSGKTGTSHSPRIHVNEDGPLMLKPVLQVKFTVSPSTKSVSSVTSDSSGLTPSMEYRL